MNFTSAMTFRHCVIAISLPMHVYLPQPNTISRLLSIFFRASTSTVPSSHLSGQKRSASSPNIFLSLSTAQIETPILVLPGMNLPSGSVSPSGPTCFSRSPTMGGWIRSTSFTHATRYGSLRASSARMIDVIGRSGLRPCLWSSAVRVDSTSGRVEM